MKKYRLKKDTPTAAAGTVCTTLSDQEHIIVDPYGVEYDVAKIDNFDEWFEEVEEFEEWKPKEGGEYKRIGLAGNVYTEAFAADSLIDNFQLSIGNCYPIDTPDELIIKERNLIPQAMHRLKMAAKKAWFELNGSEGPDFSGPDVSTYSIQYDFYKKCFNTYYNGSYRYLEEVYFPTQESAQAYIDNNPEDMKLLFGVE